MYIIYCNKDCEKNICYEEIKHKVVNISNNRVNDNNYVDDLIEKRYVGIIIRFNNKTILSDRCYIYNPNVILKYKLYNSLRLINFASLHGKVNVLEWWKNSGLQFQYDEYALNWASSNGQVAVLEWWKNSGLPLKYDKETLNMASLNGHVAVLEWWKNSGLELKYGRYALFFASQEGHINVLEWWKNSGLALAYDEKILQYNYKSSLSQNQDAVIKWWKNSGLPLAHDDNASTIKSVPKSGYINIFGWLKKKLWTKN
jgi:hypothetical protein